MDPHDDRHRGGRLRAVSRWIGTPGLTIPLSVGVALTVSALAGCERGDGLPVGDGVLEANAIVTRVIDGDTIDVVIDGRDDRVRLTGIDTPEIAHEAFDGRPANDAECYGEAAHAYTRSLLPDGTAVRLERDVVARDDYGRLLAYVHRASDGIFVNYEIVRQGYAQPLAIPPNVAHTERFARAAVLAERDDAGLWSACADAVG